MSYQSVYTYVLLYYTFIREQFVQFRNWNISNIQRQYNVLTCVLTLTGKIKNEKIVLLKMNLLHAFFLFLSRYFYFVHMVLFPIKGRYIYVDAIRLMLNIDKNRDCRLSAPTSITLHVKHLSGHLGECLK